MSYFLQCAENHCLYYAYVYAVEKKYIEDKKADLCYDGFTAKLCDGCPDIVVIEKDLTDHIFAETGIAMIVKQKDFKEYVPSIVNPIIVKDDKEAAMILFNMMKSIFVSDLTGRLFYKQGNVWISEPNAIDDAVMWFIMHSCIFKKTSQNKTISFCGNISGITSIYKALCILIKTENRIDIYQKFHSTTKGKICFNDGVLDFVNRYFLTWDEIADKKIELYTCMCIPYDYADYHASPNNTLITDIKEAIFTNMFGDKTDTALHFLGRAMTGFNDDKNWATYLGSRDCGKGVIYEALKSAFGDYVATFELGNLLYERSTDNNEVSRKLYWLLPLEFVRLAVSQETPPKEKCMKFNCGMMKKLAGGGDTHVARRNYDRVDTHFTIDPTFMIFGNDELILDSKDANEHRVHFTSCNQFKTADEINALVDDMIASGGNEEEIQVLKSKFKPRDPHIKEKCRSTEWKLAIVRILYDNYINQPVDIAFNSDDCEIDCLRKDILLKYKFTHKYTDAIPIKDVYDTLGADKKKIDAEMKDMKIERKKMNTGEHRNKMCFIGLVLKQPAFHVVSSDEIDDM
jgi:hypothetical protein